MRPCNCRGLLSHQHSKVMDRRTGAEHGDMLYQADGYVAASLMWHLQGDETAAKAFTGSEPELLKNSLYQDQKIDYQKAGNGFLFC